MPDVLDISHLKGKGLQPGEEELPEVNESQSKQGLKNNLFQSNKLFCSAAKRFILVSELKHFVTFLI